MFVKMFLSQYFGLLWGSLLSCVLPPPTDQVLGLEDIAGKKNHLKLGSALWNLQYLFMRKQTLPSGKTKDICRRESWLGPPVWLSGNICWC